MVARRRRKFAILMAAHGGGSNAEADTAYTSPNPNVVLRLHPKYDKG